MKKLTLAAFAALTIVALAPAQGQNKMHGMMHGSKMSVHECCMEGLSASEQKNAMNLMNGWSRDEKEAWAKRCSICMADPHTMLMKMEKDHAKITPAMIHMHMVSGLSKSQAMAMDKILADKKDGALLMKMAENCCMYGVHHAGHMGK